MTIARHQYTFRWTFDDHMRAQRQVMRHMIGGTWLKILPGLAAALLLIVVIALIVAGPTSRSEAFFTALPYVLILALIVFMMRWGSPWLAARRTQRDDPAVRGDFTHSVGDHAFTIEAAGSKVELTWDHIRQVVETPDFFLYYYRPKWAYFTPKRAIPPADLPSLRAALRSHLGTRVRLLEDGSAAA